MRSKGFCRALCSLSRIAGPFPPHHNRKALAASVKSAVSTRALSCHRRGSFRPVLRLVRRAASEGRGPSVAATAQGALVSAFFFRRLAHFTPGRIMPFSEQARKPGKPQTSTLNPKPVPVFEIPQIRRSLHTRWPRLKAGIAWITSSAPEIQFGSGFGVAAKKSNIAQSFEGTRRLVETEILYPSQDRPINLRCWLSDEALICQHETLVSKDAHAERTITRAMSAVIATSIDVAWKRQH